MSIDSTYPPVDLFPSAAMPTGCTERAATSERFSATDADIVLLSSDDVQIKVHRKNVEVHSDIFTDADTVSDPSDSSVIRLSETSIVPDLLLQFMYRQPQPNLGEVDFAILSEVTEAAEKYRVHSAIPICSVYMRNAIAGHPAEVLIYAVKHNHHDVVDEAAPSVLEVPIEQLLSTFTDLRLLRLWVSYYMEWRGVLELAHDTSCMRVPHNSSNCRAPGTIEKAVIMVLNNLGADPASLRKLNEKFRRPEDMVRNCHDCSYAISDWRSRVQGLMNKIPKFSSFL